MTFEGTPAVSEDIWRRAAELRTSRTPAALVTVVATTGSTPRKPGSKAIVFSDGRIEGSVGGGRVEFLLQECAAQAILSGATQLIEHQLTTELGMCCGGRMTFFVEPLIMNPSLIILGCGHIGQSLARAAQPIGFEIIACDGRDDFSSVENFPEGSDVRDSLGESELDILPWGAHAYVVVCTHDHALDQRLLEYCMDREWAYLGVIGSARKAAKQRKRLEAKGYAAERISSVHCPIGLQLGGQTPEEIAVSICAEMIAHRYTAQGSL